MDLTTPAIWIKGACPELHGRAHAAESLDGAWFRNGHGYAYGRINGVGAISDHHKWQNGCWCARWCFCIFFNVKLEACGIRGNGRHYGTSTTRVSSPLAPTTAPLGLFSGY